MRSQGMILILFVSLLSAVPLQSYSQAFNLEVQEYIHEHKITGPTHTARNTVEVINEKSHKENKKGAEHYKAANDSLGFYYKAFNWVDIGFNALKFGYNAYQTYNLAKDRIDRIVNLLDQYQQLVLQHGSLDRGDEELIRIGQEMYENITSDVDAIIASATAIGGYVALKFPCTTYSMLQDLKRLNDCLDHIRLTLNIAYSRLYQFMLARLGWQWNFAYTPIDRKALSESAIGRWCQSARRSVEVINSISPTN